jgi:hypothetical protein
MFGLMAIGTGKAEDILTATVIGQGQEGIMFGLPAIGNTEATVIPGEGVAGNNLL